MKESVIRLLGRLAFVVLAAVVLVTCKNDDDLDVSNHYLPGLKLNGTFDGTWDTSAMGLYVGYMSNISGFNEENVILEGMEQKGDITLTADSITFNTLASGILTNIFVYQLYSNVYESTEQWPVNVFGIIDYKPYTSHLTELGRSERIIYLMVDNTKYKFPARINNMDFTIEATMSVPGMCVINDATRLIVVDFNLESLHAEGLEPGFCGLEDGEFTVKFAKPELLRFTSGF